MKAKSSRHTWISSLLIVVSLSLLTGCQILGNQQNAVNDSVVVGTASVDFGKVAVGSSKSIPNTLTNFKTSSVTIVSIAGLDANFQISGITLPLVLGPGQESQFSVVFQPATAGTFSKTIQFGDNTQFLASVSVTGEAVEPGQLTLNPSSVSFGNVKVGSTQTNNVTLSNSGATDLTINQATLSGASFSMSNLALPLTLHAGGTASFSVTFAPTGVGNFSGSVSFSTSAAAQARAQRKKAAQAAPADEVVVLPLNGVGVTSGVLSANPASLAFVNVQLGKNSAKSETITNTGSSPVTISQANITGAGFSITGLTLPTTLDANQSVTFTVRFAPTAAGAVSGNLAVVSDASNSTLNIAISGTGVTEGQITPNPASLSFGNVVIGSSKTLAETLTNSGGSSLTISAASASGSGITLSGLALPLTLTAGESTTFNVKFTPASAGAVSGNVTITSDGANPVLNIPVSGNGVTPGALSANPSSLAFGSVQVGSSSTLSETLTNTGGANVNISQANVTGAGYSISGLTLPATLTPNQSMSFTVKFAPGAAGVVNGNVAIVSDASDSPLNIALSGDGLAPGSLTANPSSVNFGNVIVGNSQTVPVTITNTGGVDVTISNASTTGAGFSFTGPNLPVTVTAGQSTAFKAIFTPSAAGNSSGTLTITSNANNPTLKIPLTGKGVTQGQITPNPASLSFGNVVIGGSKTLTETLTNSGGSSLTISAASASGAGFSISGLALPLTLTAGQNTSFIVQFAPAAAGAVSGNVNITSNGANPSLDIPLSAKGVTPGTLSANPTTLSFGNVQVGSNASLSETLTNTGGTTVTISQANVTGSGFSITGLTLPTTLTSGQSVTFTATFAPAATGAASGNVAIISDASNSTLNIPTSGTGTAQGQLSVSPGTLNFGNVTVGASAALGGTLNATGASVTVTSGTSNSGEFVLSGITFPKTIAAGGSATFTVTFTPNATGAANATLTFVSSATNSPTVQTLTGNGQAPPPHSVDLSWNASQSQGVVGYNIYRRSPSGSYVSPLNSSLDAALTYTDNTVSAGQTYLYVARAVDGNNVESGNSNEVQVVVPTP